MLRRVAGYFTSRSPDGVPVESIELERDGCTIIRGALGPDEVEALRQDINRVFDEYSRDDRTGGKRPEAEDDMFRYEMFNRSEVCQRAIAHPRILEVIEPLLGEDCHVIANTAWRNTPKPNDPAQAWHVDAGPHVPLPDGVEWPEDIPHPVFAIGAHIFLKDCTEGDGPTGVLPGSHLSGRFPPVDELMNENLTYKGRGAVKLICNAGDVGLFVSDVWHRRLPTGPNDQGRFFLQVHYGRRDIAQRVRTTAQVNQVSADAISRAGENKRARTIIGLHSPYFYDG
ncbi:MAG: phytanoyl-CoA dioxygenase family protein [Pseudomonadales bacterium]|nr:phytanoyl-CoA dioxygenase family protein [Pseudomonadales bacterium]